MSEALNIRLPLPEGDGFPAVLAASYRPRLAAAMSELHASAVRLGELDPQTGELVRLRCASWHQCRVCKSLREVVNGHRVLDESLAVKVAGYEDSDLSERHKVALRLADAFMTVPGALDQTLTEQVRQHFSDGEVIEMLLDIIAWTQQKPLVSLALDIPPDPSALSSIEFDEAGHYAIGGTPIG
jgi:alkylhydroperoxidase family enzyme